MDSCDRRLSALNMIVSRLLHLRAQVAVCPCQFACVYLWLLVDALTAIKPYELHSESGTS